MYSVIEKDWKKYKLTRFVEKNESDIHHIVGRKERLKYNTNIEQNKIKISRRLHMALNAFFGDKQNPREQLQQVYELVKPVLSRWVQQELNTILYEADDELFYIPEILKWKKKSMKKAITEKGADTD